MAPALCAAHSRILAVSKDIPAHATVHVPLAVRHRTKERVRLRTMRAVKSPERSESSRASFTCLLEHSDSATLTDCGVEQLVARRAHNPEVAGSSPVPATSRVVANSSLSANARTTRPPDEHHEGASFVLCAGISRRCQRVDHRGACLCLPWTSPAGRSTAPARRPESASVSPSLSPGRVLG